MPELDDRLRAALRDLGDAAARRIHPPGADRVPVAARRRRRAGFAVAAALVLVLAGAATAGWRLVDGSGPARSSAASGCVPTDAAAFLPEGATDAVRNQVRDV